MKPNEVIQKPLVTEKVNQLTDKFNRYSFVVDKRANKLEIRKAVSDFYGVTVMEVNTIVVPAKARTKFTTSGVLKGRKPGYKKAIVTIADGETIDLFSF
jgi:large subunit ribosomal protein L23